VEAAIARPKGEGWHPIIIGPLVGDVGNQLQDSRVIACQIQFFRFFFNLLDFFFFQPETRISKGDRFLRAFGSSTHMRCANQNYSAATALVDRGVTIPRSSEGETLIFTPKFSRTSAKIVLMSRRFPCSETGGIVVGRGGQPPATRKVVSGDCTRQWAGGSIAYPYRQRRPLPPSPPPTPRKPPCLLYSTACSTLKY
jgi:hypothetical protein